ncbi:P-loop containing nucleoside triphosphate hydrolase protein [Globomyces pollinis-pini]|nr:P-loop containing nucleoside triphosphate hydrolase protein [Globomyces pollinis-pini]
MLKVKPIAVNVKDLSIISNHKHILNNINLDLVPGQIIAILGASGSGKTTLLNVLAGRFANKNQISGSIQFNHQDPLQYYTDGSCAFVQQFDYLMPNLTVRETLQYAAEFGLGSSITKGERNEIVESTILELGLKECANARIGDSWNKGISGGEKRRVSVGCQLLTNPSLIFLDEPTTGLDAFSAYNLMEILKNLSRKGRTIFITIHQPRSDIFLLFDSIILLSKGECVYAAAGATKLTNYLASHNHICPTQKNPGDFVIDLISIDDGDKAVELESKTRVNRLSLQMFWQIQIC